LLEPAATRISKNSLLAYYPFDVDYSNSHNSQAYNLQQAGSSSPVISSTIAKQGSAVYFSSENALISNEFVDYFDNASNKSLTIAYWLRHEINSKLYRTSVEIFENAFVRGETTAGISRTSVDWPTINRATSNNTWYHIAVTYDYSAQTYKLYVDGQLRGTQSNIATLNINGGLFVVGAGANGSAVNYGQKGFIGTIDELFVFNRALSQAEVSGLYELAPLIEEYEVTFSAVSAGGTISASINGNPISSGDKVAENTMVTFTAHPSSGYVVAGWQQNASQLIFREGPASIITRQIGANTDITVSFRADDTSINESKATESAITLFPNPTSSYVVVQASDAIDSITLFDAFGSIVAVENGNLSDNQTIILPNLPKGMYVVKVQTKQGESISKLLIN
jgi:hypothetical protein